jgi:hypothetical protein
MNKTQLIETFKNKIKNLDNIKSTKDSLNKFFNVQKLDIEIGSTPSNLNELFSAKNDNASAVAIPVAYDFKNILNPIKEGPELKEYYDLMKKSLNLKTAKIQGEQKSRKEKLDIEKKIADKIKLVSDNFSKIDTLYTDSIDHSKHCIEALELPYSNNDILKTCNTSTLNRINGNIEEINKTLTSIKTTTSQILAKYFVGKLEYSSKFTDYLNAKSHFKSLKEFNDKVVQDYSAFPDTMKISSTIKEAAKKVFEKIVDLQIDISDTISSSSSNAITEERKKPTLGDYEFSLNYDLYLKELDSNLTTIFKNNLKKLIDTKAFLDIELLGSVQESLTDELNTFCPTLGFAGTEEDQMYCSFKEVISDFDASQKAELHTEL